MWEEGVSAGTYQSLYEDRDGTFFGGNGRVVWQEMLGSTGDTLRESTPKTRAYRPGGIWLPKNDKTNPKIYSVFEANPKIEKDTSAASNNAANTVAMNQVGNNGIGYGTAAAGGAIGSAIGGALANAMIKADDGKMFLWPEIKDAELTKRLKNVTTCQAAVAQME